MHPTTLETLARSPDLPSGGHLWCGGVVAHANGDLYMVNGNYVHRLTPECKVVAERQLPLDCAYNGLLILADGNLITKNLGHKPGQKCTFTVLEPEELREVCTLSIPESSMGRFSCDLTAHAEHIYFTTETQLKRLSYNKGRLKVDAKFPTGCYHVNDATCSQSAGWDTCIGNGNVWMMDSGRPPYWRGFDRATAPQRAFRFSIENPKSDMTVLDSIGTPHAWNPGPCLLRE